jgi:hypothetical protein
VRVGRIWAGVCLALLAATLLLLQVLAVRTETVNWDEFGLLSRAHESLRTGRLQGGGRPGLASIVAMPIVQGCTDGVSAVRKARHVWLVFTVLLVAGTWALLRKVCRRSASPALAASLGTGLLVFVPVFLRWSLQVRADQPALLASVWSGVVLLGKGRRWEHAFAAGCLLGTGYLFSQKAFYIGLLAITLAAGDVFVDREWEMERELRRAAAFAGGGLAALAGYRLLVSRFFALPPLDSWGRVTGAFPGYRASIGFSAYVGMLPTLVPHAVLVALLAWATWHARPLGERPEGRTLVVAWAVVALGVAVGAFHAGAFPYFWMTLGIFPAVALALGFDRVLHLLDAPRDRAILVALIGLLLAVPSIRASILLQEDSQAPQRMALAFVSRNFAPEDRGFQPESALFCRPDPAPFPTFFSQDIAAAFYGADAPERIANFIREFRARPIRFLVSSIRLQQFPAEVRQFWAVHYAPYRDNVFVAGRELEGEAGTEISFDLLAPGRYRWWPGLSAGADAVSIDGTPVVPHADILLEAGPHGASLRRQTHGWLTLALRDPPGDGPFPPFYGLAMLRENSGIRASRP